MDEVNNKIPEISRTIINDRFVVEKYYHNVHLYFAYDLRGSDSQAIITIPAWLRTTIGTLQEGYRPKHVITQSVNARNSTDGQSYLLYLLVNTDGTVQLWNYNNASNISVNQYAFDVSYLVD